MKQCVFIFLCLFAAVAAGCTYQMGDQTGWHWSSPYRQDIRTVAVKIFTSRDYHRGVEFQISDALVKKIEEFTPYKVVPRERADTLIEGEVVSVVPQDIVIDPHNALPQQEQYTITVNFTWKDLHTGKVLIARSNFEQTSTYYPTLGEDQSVASQDSAERLAMGIVQEMESAW